jgi:hypothetical protein
VLNQLKIVINTPSRLAATIVILLSVFLGLLLVWGRGLYMDDYFYRYSALDIATGNWKPLLKAPYPFVRDLGQIVGSNTANAIPRYEFLVRFAWACLHATSTLLVSLFMFRCTRNEPISVISGLLYAAPYLAHEAILWHIQMVHQMGILVFLIVLHLLLLSVTNSKYRIQLTALACFGIVFGLQFSEMAVVAVAFLPLSVILRGLFLDEKRKWRSQLQISIILTAIGCFVAVLYYIFVVGRSSSVSGRGGLILDPTKIAEKLVLFLKTAYWFALDPEWGAKIAKDSFWLGWVQVTEQPLGLIGLGAIVVSGCIWAFYAATPSSLRLIRLVTQALIVSMFGLIWALISLVPGALLGGQILEWRMLYFSLIGVGICAAGIFWMLAQIFGKISIHLSKIVYLFPIGIALCCVFILIGQARIYQLRSQTDMRQVTELISIAPSSTLPAKPVFVPIYLDIRLVSPQDINPQVLDRLLFGAFEIPWAARSILWMEYQRNDLDVVTTHHWTYGMHFKYQPASESTPESLIIEGQTVPLDQIVAFTYQNNKVLLIHKLEITDANGVVQQVVEVPFTRSVNQQFTIDSLKVLSPP